MRVTPFFIAATAAFLASTATAADARPPALKCEIGPISKNFGSTPWLVYSCSDGKTIVVVSAPGSAAAPFYFVYAFVDGAYRLDGEGSGDKNATDAAYVDLKNLSTADINALILETRSAPAVAH